MKSALLTLVLLFAGCAVDEGGSFDLQIVGVDGAVADSYTMDWDGGVTWTREVGCALGEIGSDPAYIVSANDRSLGELTVAITVQAFEGAGDYERDEFQPTPLLSIDWTDPGSGEAWHLGTDTGGRCAVVVEEPNRSGTLSCVDVVAFRDQEQVDGLGSILAAWSCGVVSRDSPISARRSRSGRSPTR